MTYSTGDNLGFELMHPPYLNCGIPDVLHFGHPGLDQYHPGCYLSSEHKITCSIVAANGGGDSVTLFFSWNECFYSQLLFFFKLSGGTSLQINFYMTPSVSLRLVVFNVFNPVNLYDVSKQNDDFLDCFGIKYFKLRFQ